MNDSTNIIKGICLTEKASILSDSFSKYVFRVTPKATKSQVKESVQKLFGKKVLSVNTANYAGKVKRQRTASSGRKAHWKKAIVTLERGEKIDLA